MRQCPDSGSGASCSVEPAGPPAAGVSSTPAGQAPCSGATASNPGSAAACANVALPDLTSVVRASSSRSPRVEPSIPVASLGPVRAASVELQAGAGAVAAGQAVVLTATSSGDVAATGNAIEIFDQSTGTLAAECTHGSQCVVSYAAQSGVHTFAAFVTHPSNAEPAPGTVAAASTPVAVMWAAVKLSARTPIVAPGKSVTLTAATTAPSTSDYQLQIFDAGTGARISYCSQGTSCTVSITQAAGGSRSVVAAYAKPSSTFPVPDPIALSGPLSLTWLSIDINGGSAFALGASVSITATANIDLANTPYSIGILDDQGRLVGAPCKSVATCSAQLNLPAGQTPSFSAAIGEVPPAPAPSGKLGRMLQKVAGPGALVNIQARSAPVQPQRLLWGVDSCKAFTSDPAGGSGLLPQVVGSLGTPDFWGRYLTNTFCPGLSPAEIAAAHSRHMGILPIYNDYDCSNVAGYATGRQYAAAAAAAAVSLGIPAGRGLAIDIEPPGDACPGAANVDTGFIQGWYDGITLAHYAPAYYGDTTPGSAFATQWCNATAAVPDIGQHSYLWSFEPSLLGGYGRGNAPGFSPNLTRCLGFVHTWQYVLSAGSNPDVDQDESTSVFPFWYP